MIKVIISGCNGRMGQVVAQMCRQRKDMEIVAGFDPHAEKHDLFPVYAVPLEYTGNADVIIDFSNAAGLEPLLAYATQRHIPMVVCTTGHSPEQLKLLSEAANTLPIFKSGNMSIGINLLLGLAKKAAAVLGENFDVEIVERHHRMKVDAPSGTALMLADAVAAGLPHESNYIYERQSVRRPRGPEELGISSIRGGTIVGEHEVIFAGTDEVVELKHKAYSREIFANGAVTAAAWIAAVQAPGMYDMQDVLAEVLQR